MKQAKLTKKRTAAKTAKIKGESLSTFEQEMLDPKFKAEFEEEYKKLALKELILARLKSKSDPIYLS